MEILPIPAPDPDAIDRLRSALSTFNRTQFPDRGYLPVCFHLLDANRQFSGGLFAWIAYGWLFIDTLWIAESSRGQRWGSRLLLAAEETARQHGCRNAWLDTFDFQARTFYERLGYSVFATLDDFPPGHQRFFLRK